MSNIPQYQHVNEGLFLSERYWSVLERLRAAEKRFGRQSGSVNLVAISKTQTSETIRHIAEIKQKDFGENQVQEAVKKITRLSDLTCVWHFVGSIQTNKCRDIATYFDWVHSIDRLKIAKRLSGFRPIEASPLNIFLQVNLQGEDTKSGVSPEAVATMTDAIRELPGLRLRGLMAIPAPETNLDSQRKVFSRLRVLQTQLNRDLDLQLDCLSMGMTNDLEAAVAEGATHVRIGTAIFGPRKI